MPPRLFGDHVVGYSTTLNTTGRSLGLKAMGNQRARREIGLSHERPTGGVDQSEFLALVGDLRPELHRYCSRLTVRSLTARMSSKTAWPAPSWR
jgi:hypothetical protein